MSLIPRIGWRGRSGFTLDVANLTVVADGWTYRNPVLLHRPADISDGEFCLHTGVDWTSVDAARIVRAPDGAGYIFALPVSRSDTYGTVTLDFSMQIDAPTAQTVGMYNPGEYGLSLDMTVLIGNLTFGPPFLGLAEPEREYLTLGQYELLWPSRAHRGEVFRHDDGRYYFGLWLWTLPGGLNQILFEWLRPFEE